MSSGSMRRRGIPGPESRTGLTRPSMTEAEFERRIVATVPAAEPSGPAEPGEAGPEPEVAPRVAAVAGVRPVAGDGAGQAGDGEAPAGPADVRHRGGAGQEALALRHPHRQGPVRGRQRPAAARSWPRWSSTTRATAAAATPSRPPTGATSTSRPPDRRGGGDDDPSDRPGLAHRATATWPSAARRRAGESPMRKRAAAPPGGGAGRLAQAPRAGAAGPRADRMSARSGGRLAVATTATIVFATRLGTVAGMRSAPGA